MLTFSDPAPTKTKLISLATIVALLLAGDGLDDGGLPPGVRGSGSVSKVIHIISEK